MVHLVVGSPSAPPILPDAISTLQIHVICNYAKFEPDFELVTLSLTCGTYRSAGDGD
jgi:hypothetical protein